MQNKDAFNMTLLQAKAIWIDAPQKMNRYVWLMPPAPLKTGKTITVRIASSVPYQLYVNGKFHSYGPWRGSRNLVFVTTHTIRPDSPETRIAFLAHHPARPSSEMDMGSPWFMAECRDAAGKILASTDGNWCVSESEEWKRSVPSSWFLRGMAEVFHCSGNGRAPAVPALEMSGTARELPDVILDGIHIEQEVNCPPSGPEIPPKRWLFEPLPEIRRLPPDQAAVKQKRTEDRWQSSMGVWHQGSLGLYSPEKLEYIPVDASSLSFSHRTGWTSSPACGLKKCKGPGMILFDFEEIASGFLSIRIRCSRSCHVDFLFGADEYPDLLEGAPGIDWADCGAVDFRRGETVWTSFRSQGLRYLLLLTESAEVISSLSCRIVSTAFSLPEMDTADIGDKVLARSLKVAARTLEMGCGDALFDCPTRERAQWLGDGILNGRVMADMLQEPAPLRRLVHLIVRDAEPGHFLKAVIPSSFLDEIPVCDLLIIENIVWYARNYEPQAEWLVPFLKGRVRTFLPHVTPDGLLDEMPGRQFMDWAQECAQPPAGAPRKKPSNPPAKGAPYDFMAPRTRGMNAVVNANWIRMLHAVSEGCIMQGDSAYPEQISKLEELAKKSYVKRFLDRRSGLITERLPKLDSGFSPSELPCYAALAAGVVSRQDAEKMIRCCTDPEKLMLRIGSPSGSRYVVEGLIRYGHTERALDYVKTVFGPMIRNGKTLWEAFEGGTRCHAWGSYSLYSVWKSVIGK